MKGSFEFERCEYNYNCEYKLVEVQCSGKDNYQTTVTGKEANSLQTTIFE